MSTSAFTALVAEDEPLQARGLCAELARVWPQLEICAVVGDGDSAISKALELLPDILFLDIRMPARSGIEVAATLAEEWPADRPFAKLVFVTAYDQYAVQAFEHQAVDYLLKPLQADRLQRTVDRLRLSLAQARTSLSGAAAARAGAAAYPLDGVLAEQLIVLQDLLAQRTSGVSGTSGVSRGSGTSTRAATSSASPALSGPFSAAVAAAALTPMLKFIQASSAASQGNVIRVVPIDEVLCFQAADKYVRVLTAGNEYLIRTPLRELIGQLDANVFWQVHRNTLVRVSAIERVQREDTGKARVFLRFLTETLPVSRLYLHRFKAM